MSTTLLVLLLITTLFVLIGFMMFRVQRQAYALERLTKLFHIQESRFVALQNDFSALCSGALGVDSRVSNNEQRVRALLARLEELEADEQRQGEQTYQSAIEMAQQGSSAEELIQRFELTSDEAELLIRLYQLET